MNSHAKLNFIVLHFAPSFVSMNNIMYNIFGGSTDTIFVFATPQPLFNGDQLGMEINDPLGANYFPLNAESNLKSLCVAGKQTYDNWVFFVKVL